MSTESHHVDPNDSLGKKVGAQAAILAVLLSVFTICAHRAHTETIAMGNEATNEWAHYQAKRIREYQLEMNTDLLRLTAPNNPETAKTIAGYAKQRAKYSQELDEIKKTAEERVKEGALAHRKASYFDLSEGVLEIALVLSSLYFLSHKKLFPFLGLSLGAGGIVVGLLGLFF